MSREDAVAVVQRLVRVARQRDVSQLAECYAADAVAISPVFGEGRGREQIAATWQTLFDTFADADVDVSDTLVMFTDGVTEARSARNEEFGEDRLMASLTEDASAPIVVLNRVFAAVREFCQHTEPSDDITVTVTRFQ